MQPLGRPPVPEEYTMEATSLRSRGTNCADELSLRNSSQRCAPDKSAFGGASVTRTVCRLAAVERAGDAASCRQIGYSVMRIFAPECWSNCQCSAGVSL